MTRRDRREHVILVALLTLVVLAVCITVEPAPRPAIEDVR